MLRSLGSRSRSKIKDQDLLTWSLMLIYDLITSISSKIKDQDHDLITRSIGKINRSKIKDQQQWSRSHMRSRSVALSIFSWDQDRDLEQLCTLGCHWERRSGEGNFPARQWANPLFQLCTLLMLLFRHSSWHLKLVTTNNWIQAGAIWGQKID